MDTVTAVTGAVLVLAVVVDVFHTVLHPSGQGRLTHAIMRGVWKALPARVSVVGPLAVLSVVLVWVVLSVVGWALLYLPHLPEGAVYASGLDVSERSTVLDSVYLSLVVFATLGLGDIVPATGWLRIATPLEALTGFALLTAAVSWFLQIYPALTRRRALSARLALLRRASVHNHLPTADSSAMASLLESLAADLAQTRVDLTQHAETFYFRDAEPDCSLPVQARYALELARAGRRSDRRDVRLCAEVLVASAEDLAHAVSASFRIPTGTTDEVLDAFAAAHGHPVDAAPAE